MAPVDQLAVGMERAELEEGVIGSSIDQEAVGVVEPSHGWNDVEARIIGVVGRGGSSNSVQGQALEVLSHARMLAGPLPRAGWATDGRPAGGQF